MDNANFSEEFLKVKEYFEKAIQLVRYNKTKDDIIEKTGKDIQKYREGFSLSAFKSLAVAIINYRENCKKELSDLSVYEYDAEKLKKNYDLIADDLKDLLLDNGAEEQDGKFFYMNKDVLAPIEIGEKKACDCQCEKPCQETPCECQEGEEKTPCECACEEQAPECERQEKSLTEVLEEYQNQLIKTLEDNAKLEAFVKSAFDNARKIDEENKYITVYPVMHKLAKLSLELEENVKKFPETEDFKAEYANVLTCVIDKTTLILEILGVTIDAENPETDKMVTGYHRLVKVVPTEVEADDRKIAKTLSDAYTFDGKVVYPQKVEVFKFVKK